MQFILEYDFFSIILIIFYSYHVNKFEAQFQLIAQLSKCQETPRGEIIKAADKFTYLAIVKCYISLNR